MKFSSQMTDFSIISVAAVEASRSITREEERREEEKTLNLTRAIMMNVCIS